MTPEILCTSSGYFLPIRTDARGDIVGVLCDRLAPLSVFAMEAHHAARLIPAKEGNGAGYVPPGVADRMRAYAAAL